MLKYCESNGRVDIDIDVSSHKADLVFDCLNDYYKSIGGRMIKVGTFGTETSKSAVLSSFRGLGLNVDEATYVSSLIPVTRGKVRSIHDCYYGNEEKGLEPVYEFKNKVDEYAEYNLLETMIGVEGLINKRSVHACFDKDTLITTDKGLKKISKIKEGDIVLTHDGSYQKVLNTVKTKTNEEYLLYSKNMMPTKVTPNHPYLTFNKNKNGIPSWKEAKDLEIGKDYVGSLINTKSCIPSYPNYDLPFNNPVFWWIVGRYIGDGWTEKYYRQKPNGYKYTEERVIICCSKVTEEEKNEITQKLESIGFVYRTEERRTTYKIHIKRKGLFNYLQRFGKYAHKKRLHSDVFNLPIKLGESFMDGYISADGNHYDINDSWELTTVSPYLAQGVAQVINKVYHQGVVFSINKPKIEKIEGRAVHSKKKYRLHFFKNPHPNEESFYYGGYIWAKLKKKEAIKQNNKTMYNLTVENTHSYVANGIVVHNCGQCPINYEIYKHGASMKAPNGSVITQYDLSDCEYMGMIKFDFLKTKCMGMLQICMELLLEYGKIEWQGSLKETYDKYLVPEVLERYDQDMWAKLPNLIGAFQYDSPVKISGIA